MKKYLFSLIIIFLFSSLSFGQTSPESDVAKSEFLDESMKNVFYSLRKKAEILLDGNKRLGLENSSLKKKVLAFNQEIDILKGRQDEILENPVDNEKVVKNLNYRIENLKNKIGNVENQILLLNAQDLNDQKWMFKFEKENGELSEALSTLMQKETRLSTATKFDVSADVRKLNQKLNKLKRKLLASQNYVKKVQKEYQERQKILLTLKAAIRNSLNDTLRDDSLAIFSSEDNEIVKEIAKLKEGFDKTCLGINQLIEKAENEGLFLGQEIRRNDDRASLGYFLTDFRYQEQKLSLAVEQLKSEVEDLKDFPERERIEKDQKVSELNQDILELKVKIEQAKKKRHDIVCAEEDMFLARIEGLKTEGVSLSSQIFDLNMKIRKEKKAKDSFSGILQTISEVPAEKKRFDNNAECSDASCERPQPIIFPKSAFKMPEILK